MKKYLLLTLMIPVLWLAHRTEFDVGRVLNEDGDGKLYNGEPYYNYIAYPRYYDENDIILTVSFLNPLNNECDDMITRMDIRLLRNI